MGKSLRDLTYSKIFNNRFVGVSHNWEKMFYKSVPTVARGLVASDRDTERFVTYSTYKGTWDTLGMCGHGRYTFPNGIIYEGMLKDGMFHGSGSLIYPMGQRLEGIWDDGKMRFYRYVFSDGLEYFEPWDYCIYPDRRFHSSVKEGLKPAGHEYITNIDPPRKIPDRCYDVGEGFFNPETKCIMSAYQEEKVLRVLRVKNQDFLSDLDIEMFGSSSTEKVKLSTSAVTMTSCTSATGQNVAKKMLSIPSKKYGDWIIENCRKAWDEPTGYRPDLYQQWTSGKQSSMKNISSAEDKNIIFLSGIRAIENPAKAMSRHESTLFKQHKFKTVIDSHIIIRETVGPFESYNLSTSVSHNKNNHHDSLMTLPFINEAEDVKSDIINLQ